MIHELKLRREFFNYVRFGADNQVKFILPLPKIEDFSLTKTGRKQAESGRHDALECAHWQRCCALKGIPAFEAYVTLDTPLSDFANLLRKSAYENGCMPEILSMLEEGKL